MTYTIGKASEMTGLTTSQLRYYDKEGLLPNIRRSESGIRHFTDSDFHWLNIVTCLKNSGVPIKRIRQFVDWAAEGDGTIEQRLEFMREQKRYLEQKMQELEGYMETVEGKIRYYEIAAEAGTTAVHDNLDKAVAL